MKLCISPLCSIIILLLFPIHSWAQISFEKLYDGSHDEFAFSMVQTTDGGYILGGEARAMSGALDYDVWLVRTDAMGDVIWTQTLGGPGQQGFGYVRQTYDGGFIVTGYSDSIANCPDFTCAFLTKLNPMGDTVWTRSMPYELAGRVIHENPDSGFILMGSLRMQRLDQFGDTLWTKNNYSLVPSWTNSSFGSLEPTSTGDFIMAGTFSNGSSTGQDGLLLKFDGNGDTLWTHRYERTGYDEFRSARQNSDGGFIVVGSDEITSQDYDVLLIRTDSMGNEIWAKTYGGTMDQHGYFAQESSDGGFLVACSDGSGPVDTLRIMLLRVDSNGDSLWTREFYGKGEAFPSALMVTPDGGVAIGGWSRRDTSGIDHNHDYLLIKTDEDGLVSAPSPHQSIKMTIYPNPADGQFQLLLPNELHGKRIELKLINSVGTVVFSETRICSAQNDLSLAGFANGIYLLSLSDPKTGSVLGYAKLGKK